MGLLGSGEECYVCGKDLDSEDCIEKDGRKFCCEKCEEKYEEEQEEPDDVCQFC